jgi:hypothetical protein
MGMQGSSYFRHQADTCFRLSASCTDQKLATRFRALAQDFLAKAAYADADNEIERAPFAHFAKAKQEDN